MYTIKNFKESIENTYKQYGENCKCPQKSKLHDILVGLDYNIDFDIIYVWIKWYYYFKGVYGFSACRASDIFNNIDVADVGKKIYNLMKQGISIDQAIEMFDLKIKNEMEASGLSAIAAIAVILSAFKTRIEALQWDKNYKQKMERKNLEYVVENCRYCLVPKYQEDLELFNEYKTKIVNGITLISKTEEGLKKLEDVVNYAYQNGDEQFLNTLSLEATRCKLCISDFKYDDNNNDFVGFYSNWRKYIWLDCLLERKIEDLAATFYHEATHFLDSVKNKETSELDDNSYFSINNLVIKNILEKIKVKAHPYRKGISINFLLFKINRYINNPVLNQKWLDSIKKEYNCICNDDVQQYMNQKRLYEKKKYKILIGKLMDIYDGLTNGWVEKVSGYGHGKEYFSNPDALFKEFIADIGAIYNSDGMDILYHELGQKLTEEIIDFYKKFIEFDTYNSKQQRAV